jgi:hypothetical protein
VDETPPNDAISTPQTPARLEEDQKRGHVPPEGPQRRFVASSGRFLHQALSTDAFLACSASSTRARTLASSSPKDCDPGGPAPTRNPRANQLSSYLIIWFRFVGPLQSRLSGPLARWGRGTSKPLIERLPALLDNGRLAWRRMFTGAALHRGRAPWRHSGSRAWRHPAGGRGKVALLAPVGAQLLYLAVHLL